MEENNENTQDNLDPVNEKQEEIKQECTSKENLKEENTTEETSKEEAKVNEKNSETKEQEKEDDENTNNLFQVHKDNFKKETTDTVKQVKDTFKNTDIKKASKEAKGFFLDFFKSPLKKLKEVVNDSQNYFLKTAIIIFVIWLVVILLDNIFGIASRYLFGYFGSFSYFFKHLFSNILIVIKDLLAPILGILILSGLVYGFRKDRKKSFLSIVTSIVIAKIPVVIASIVNLLTLFGASAAKLTSPFSNFCSILSIILLYFAVKDLVNEKEDDNFFWKFALIIGIYYVSKFILSFLGIYL